MLIEVLSAAVAPDFPRLRLGYRKWKQPSDQGWCHDAGCRRSKQQAIASPVAINYWRQPVSVALSVIPLYLGRIFPDTDGLGRHLYTHRFECIPMLLPVRIARRGNAHFLIRTRGTHLVAFWFWFNVDNEITAAAVFTDYLTFVYRSLGSIAEFSPDPAGYANVSPCSMPLTTNH